MRGSIVPLTPDAAARALLRFLVAAMLLGALATAFQERLIGAALPLFRAWLQIVDPTYRTVDLSIVRFGAQEMLQRTVTPARTHAVGARIVFSDPRTRIESRAAAGVMLHAPVLTVALVLAWPWRSLPELALRLAAAVPLLLLVLLLDVPMILYGAAWQRELALADPGGFSPLVAWADIMNAGGRFVLAVVAAALAVVAGTAWTVPRSGT